MIYYILEEGYDSVATRRVTRKGETPIKSVFARLFYKLINKISTAYDKTFSPQMRCITNLSMFDDYKERMQIVDDTDDKLFKNINSRDYSSEVLKDRKDYKLPYKDSFLRLRLIEIK